MAFEAGTLLGRLKLDHSGFARGMLEAQSISQVFGPTVAAFIANPIVGAFTLVKSAAKSAFSALREGLEFGDKIGDLSKQTNLSVRSLLGLKLAAEQSGSSLDEVVQALTHLKRAQVEAFEADPKKANDFRDAFNAIGVAITTAQGKLKPSEALFNEVADAINRLPDGATRTARAMDLFSRSGERLLPLFAEGSAGIARYTREMERLFPTLAVSSGGLADLNDALTIIPTAILGLKIDFATSLMQAMGISAGNLREGIFKLKEQLEPTAKHLGTMIGHMLNRESIDRFSNAVRLTSDAVEFLAKHIKELILLLAAYEGAKLGAKFGKSAGTVGQVVGGAVGAAGGVKAAEVALDEIQDYIERGSGPRIARPKSIPPSTQPASSQPAQTVQNNIDLTLQMPDGLIVRHHLESAQKDLVARLNLRPY